MNSNSNKNQSSWLPRFNTLSAVCVLQRTLVESTKFNLSVYYSYRAFVSIACDESRCREIYRVRDDDDDGGNGKGRDSYWEDNHRGNEDLADKQHFADSMSKENNSCGYHAKPDDLRLPSPLFECLC